MQSSSAFHIQAIVQSFNLLGRKPLASSMTILVIALALALPGFFWVFTKNLSQFTLGLQRGGHISLYLKSMTASDQTVLLEQVRDTPGVGQALLKTPEEGLEELTQQEGMEDIMHYLPDNPLPAVIEITPALMMDSPSQLSILSKQLQRLPQIEQVKLDMEWVRRLDAILKVASKITHWLMIALVMAVVLIIATTLRLVIHTRHEEIQVLKLIGAPDAFILRPFLYLGIWYGLAGATLAVILVNVFVLSTAMVLNELVSVYQMHYPLLGLSIRQILPLILFAVILGKLAAHLSVKRQLLSIEPYN
ncbi:MAG: cell division protein [Legionella sp.]|nr:cell division protein [Legionella sp.]